MEAVMMNVHAVLAAKGIFMLRWGLGRQKLKVCSESSVHNLLHSLVLCFGSGNQSVMIPW